VNTVTSSPTAEPAGLRAPARSLSDRVLAALPLLSVYVWLCLVYLVEAWKRATPWLFGDELELTQISRSIAATGHAARRGQAHSFDSLYTVMTAPLWLIHDVGAAYSAIKYVDVFVMASVVFPTYLLARLVVGRGWALFAAAGAGAIPALAYSSYIVEENLAYPYAALCFFLIAKALVTRRWPWIAAAVVASALASPVRSELAVVVLVLVLATAFSVWSSPWGRAHRSSWTLSDYVGFFTLVAGAIFLLSAFASTHSRQWYVVTIAYENRMWTMAMWAAASLTIGIGILPLIGGLASLWPARGEQADTELRAFRSITLAAIAGFGMYTAIKAAYLSTVFATRVEERNLIYVAPLLFIGTAVVLERRRVHPVALAAAAAYALYLTAFAGHGVVGSPYELGLKLYSDAPGFSILQGANRYLHLSVAQARPALIGVFAVAVVLLAAQAIPAVRRRPRALGAIAAAAGIAVVSWSLAGELGAAAATASTSNLAAATLRHPFSWVDTATRRRPTVYFGAGETDPNAENMLEFWNRSITRVSSLDGTVGGPGPADGPNLDRNGVVYWANGPGEYTYAVEDRPCVQFAGSLIATHPYLGGGRVQHWWLVRLTQPNRLVSLCMGLYTDGWSGAGDSRYFRFSGGRGGRVRVVVSRAAAGAAPASPFHVLVSPLFIDSHAYPEAARVTQRIDSTIKGGQTRVFSVRAPADRFVVQVIVDQKFVPGNGDERELGAQVSYRFVPASGRR
jgi:hypothetical protein